MSQTRSARTVLLLGCLVCLGGAAAVVLWYAASSSLPPADRQLVTPYGSAALRQDAQGVPNIEADSEKAALFALGYSHAQDRLWQMEFQRRVAHGRLAEALGPDALATDVFIRALGIQARAQAIANQLDPETRDRVDAYVDGVNQYLEWRSAPLPPEFLLTGSPAPERWTRADSLSWTLLMAWDLSSHAYRNELARLRLASTLTTGEIKEIRDHSLTTQPTRSAGSTAPAAANTLVEPTDDYATLYRLMGLQPAPQKPSTQASSRTSAATPDAALALGLGDGLGSNNWVISGARSATGWPILANDPHLGIHAPSTWYMARLSAPGLDVFGATMPGVPYVVIGRNRGVAWGFTNTGTDVQDLYLERVNPTDPTQYQTEDGYRSFETDHHTIKIKGADPVDVVLQRTKNGPVLSGASTAADTALKPGAFVLSLRWTALEGPDNTLRSLRALNQASTVREAIDALRDWTVVQQNVVLADTNGQIALVVPGKVPRRRADNGLHGIAPAPGWDPRYQWDGSLQYEDLPRVIDPPDGLIVTANNDVTPRGYPHHLNAEWDLPYRAQRIEQLLRARPTHSIESMAAIQADLKSRAALDLVNALRQLEPPIVPDSEAAKLAYERLLNWNGDMRPDAPEPLLFHTWMRELQRAIFLDDLAAMPDLVERSHMTRPLLGVLSGQNRARDWCDDRRTQRREACTQIAQEALERAVDSLTRASGRDVLGLRWGDAHRIAIEHRPLSNVPLLGRLFGREVVVGGDKYTVNAAAPALRADDPFVSRHAASLRIVADLGPTGETRWIYPGGQSGHPLSRHYANLIPMWQRVELYTHKLRPDAAPPPATPDRTSTRNNAGPRPASQPK